MDRFADWFQRLAESTWQPRASTVSDGHGIAGSQAQNARQVMPIVIGQFG